ncbi:DEAD-box type RNA helicase [Recurvomyces mirabilis]|nr:DEAD-box type RNA helicase [Recurvomyces mirabilis]
MAEIAQKIDELINLDDSIHWFCPRAYDDDSGVYHDEDCLGSLDTESAQEKTVRLAKMKEGEDRKSEILDACKILAYDGGDAEEYQTKLKKGLKAQLIRCDICVREYHRSRGQLEEMLESEYEAAEVHSFMEKFDQMNISRIGAGLNSMTESLVDLPIDKRSIRAAGDVGMYALFEALNCGPFLEKEEVLERYFDTPFRLVQTKTKLKLPSCAPGVAAFLFSKVEPRRAWAQRNIAALKRPLTGADFEHSVKKYLQAATTRVNITMLDAAFLPIFWSAMRHILDKFTADLISSHLRTMEANIYTLGMDHWQVDGTHFADQIACYQRLLELNPTAFWDAMGGMPTHALTEQITQSPALQRMLQTKEDTQPLRLEEKLAWALPLIRSIKPANLVPPARTLFRQLLHTFQKDEYSRYAQTVCWKIGLTALLETINRVRQLSGGPVVVNLIELISKEHIGSILQELDGIEKKREMSIDETEQLSLDIVEASLALDVQTLSYSRDVLVKTKALDHEVSVSGLNIWKMSMRLVKPGHPALGTAVLSGTTGLLRLEQFAKREVEAASKPTEAWNSALSRLLRHVQQDMLDRLETSTPEQLVELYQEQKAARGLMSLLFNGSEPTHQATLDIFKTLSGEDNRRDTLMHLLRAFFGTTLSSVANAQDIIAKTAIFSPCPIFLKISSDIFACLCDSEDGLLREMTLIDEEDLKALASFWEMTWTALETIFSQTEKWSQLGYDKQMLQDFCRATMDFADSTFDEYSIIATTLQNAQGDSANKRHVGKALLQFPKQAFHSITKWLRLRDDYLITKAVSLTSKMLIRLQAVGIEVDSKTATFVEDVVLSTEKNARVRTKLSMNQKAELQSALEKHLGADLDSVIEVQPLKQGTLGFRSSTPGSSGRSTPIPGAGSKVKAGTIDVDAWSKQTEADRARRQQMSEHEKAYGDLMNGSTKASEAFKKMQAAKKMPATQRAAQRSRDDSGNFLAKRKMEQEAAKKSRLAAVAKLGAGSGVAGLGDMGKDHSLKGQNVMVSSDEESGDEEDDDDMDDDLFGPKKERKKIDRPALLPDGAVGMRPDVRRGPVRIQRTQRSVKDMRARLAPDLRNLHTVILRWDYFHSGDYPPASNENLFKPVADSYRDPNSYQETFEPLLTLEAWQGMVKSREENANKTYEVKVQNRSNVDALIEISSFVSQVENRDLGLQEGDIILLSKARRPAEDATAPHCLARISKLKRQKAQIEIVYQLVPGSSLAPGLTAQTIVFAQKIQSIVPLEREYGALKGLQYYDLCMQIIRAAPSKRSAGSEKMVAGVQDIWNVNRAQAEAVQAALENEGFSLIQGPPGSGKTKTIVAIVGGLLSGVLGAAGGGAIKITVPGRTSGGGGSEGTTKKLLVCAPSNAAVDELVMRLKEGVKTRSGRHHAINVVRIGRSDAINSNVLDVTMDELVAKRMGGNGKDDSVRAKNAEVFKEHEKVSARLRELYQQRDGGELKGKELTVLENDIVGVRKKKNELGVRIDSVKDSERNAGREAELGRKRAQQAVLDEAHVICATLSGSGHDMFQSLSIEFETVIIDEAAQCVEMSSLIPLKYGCVKCIMVGDPKQLPPTVFSKEAARFSYEQSLFVRMQRNSPNEVFLLDTQYRMHPAISRFPAQAFYDGLLKDGDGLAGTRERPWHASSLLAPYRFFDVKGQHSSAPKGHSLVNVAEVEIAMMLYERLTTDFRDYDYTGRIGVITPYKSQLRLLKDKFSQRYGTEIFDTIEFNTTDAFQGRESEIIIFSCVRASPQGGIGFLRDVRRMNVGLTRAKSSLWVLGNEESLVRGEFWRKLVEDAKARDVLTGGNLKGMLSRSSRDFPAGKPAAGGQQRQAMTSATPVSTMRASPAAPPARVSSTAMPGIAPAKAAASNEPTRPVARHMKKDLVVSDETDRMDGVRYRFEDRIKSKKTSRAEPDTTDNDVEMADAPHDNEDVESVASDKTLQHEGAAPPSEEGRKSRAETPLSNASGVSKGSDRGGDKAVARADGTVKHGVGAPVSQPMAKKRPAANPLLQKKKMKPVPR